MIAGHPFSGFHALPECGGHTRIHQGGVLQNIQLGNIPVFRPGQHIRYSLVGAEYSAFRVYYEYSKGCAVTQQAIAFLRRAQRILRPPASLFKLPDPASVFFTFIDGQAI